MNKLGSLTHSILIALTLSLSGCADIKTNVQGDAHSILDRLKYDKDRPHNPAGDGGSSGG